MLCLKHEKSLSPEPQLNPIKISKNKGKKKRSASYRLPPPDPPNKMLFQKNSSDQHKLSPRTVSISNHNS